MRKELTLHAPMSQLRAAFPTALDLFCGVGGLSLGLIQSGFRLLGAVDIDQQVLDVHKANFPKVPVHQCNLVRASAGAIRKALGLENTVIDLLSGGPPCQGFSAGGVQAKRDPRNRGVMAFARLVAKLRPRYFLMENVHGLLFKKHAGLRQRFRSALRSAGYAVQPFRLLNAADFGVPQRRLRAFVIGCLAAEKLPEYPAPRPDCKASVRDAIGDLAEIDKRATGFDLNVYTGKLGKPSAYSSRLRVTRRGRPIKRQTGCLRTRHSDEVVARFKATEPGGQEPVSRFFRLSWNGFSPTIRAGTGPEHGSYTAPRPIHPKWARCITVREAARLHSFPDWFVFRGTRWHGFRQIGNSVPPLLARAVATAIIDAINSAERPDE